MGERDKIKEMEKKQRKQRSKKVERPKKWIQIAMIIIILLEKKEQKDGVRWNERKKRRDFFQGTKNIKRTNHAQVKQ